MEINTIKVASDFTPFPGARYRCESKNSGQEFREEILTPAILNAIKENTHIEIDLDGTQGYGMAFLDEVFGGLVRVDNIPHGEVLYRINIKSGEEPYLRDEILKMIKGTSNCTQGSTEIEYRSALFFLYNSFKTNNPLSPTQEMALGNAKKVLGL